MGSILIGFGEEPNTREWEDLHFFKKTDQWRSFMEHLLIVTY